MSKMSFDATPLACYNVVAPSAERGNQLRQRQGRLTSADKNDPGREMPVFTNTEQFYMCTRALFARLEDEDPSAADSIRKAHLIIRLRFTAPSAEVTINGRHNPVQTTLGPSKLQPDLDVEMAADTLHRILLGELGLRRALGGGLLKVNGLILKALVLADLFHRLQALYPQILREQGLMDS